MLKNRIFLTLTFFNLQDYPLTILELQKFLLPEKEELLKILDSEREVITSLSSKVVSTDEILFCLDSECQNLVEFEKGFYCLAGRKEIITQRLYNYKYGIFREKRIKRWTNNLKYVPFLRAAAIGGSQAMGLNKKTSDIDLFLIVDEKFLWLSRTLVTLYFQILGLRRHGRKISNRFCLNHYIAGAKTLKELLNLYSGMEYLRLRALINSQLIFEFKQNNQWWLNSLFPNAKFNFFLDDKTNQVQKFLEKIFTGKFGTLLENRLKNWQAKRIKLEQFIILKDDELSLHPQSKQQALLSKFFSE